MTGTTETGTTDTDAPRAYGWLFGARIDDEPEALLEPQLYSPFEKDWDAQLAAIGAWMERQGYQRRGYEIWSIAPPTQQLARYVAEHRISVVVIPGRGVMERMRDTWECFAQVIADVEAAGARIEIADPDARPNP
ncbi:hypothetical protein [Streptomyces sp. H27-D2]|uniref:hypothetical protein n=1 Tax=Streptomyces sp. H27-D2 TaxID=3046304 RepID=UPI002DB7B767|nr:hypothetical protein [Streptomyces sp. H27-D2]MEC4017885.1 hypothetical protein [Streptomyces sp. H27-D2]